MTPRILFEVVDNLGNEDRATYFMPPRNIMWCGRFESNEVLFHMSLCDSIITDATLQELTMCICTGFSAVSGEPNNPSTTASAGLHDDDLGFVSQTAAVTVVENFEDGVIVKNIWLLIPVLSSTDSIQDAM